MALRSLFKGKQKGVVPGLRNQFMTHASVDTKIYVAFYAVAMIDALGSPLQGTPRVTNRIIDDMRPHPTEHRPPGTWTDDTSQMLCIASAIVSAEDPEENMAEQIMALRQWKEQGHLSCTGVCFDIPSQVKNAIEMFSEYEKPAYALHIIRSTYCGDNDDDNSCGSLSRILPLAIAWWREPDQARIYGKLSSEITHPSLLCKEASSLFANLIALTLWKLVLPHWKNSEEAEKLSKLTLVREIANFPFENNDLRRFLTVPFGILPPTEASNEDLENFYYKHVPLLRYIALQQVNPLPSFPFVIPTDEELATKDHALDVTLAALYCFFATRNFEDGALMAVNLCGMSSSVGAVYAGLAAVFYVGEEEKDKLFWTKKVREWRKGLQRPDLLEGEAQKMVNLAHSRLQEELQLK